MPSHASPSGAGDDLTRVRAAVERVPGMTDVAFEASELTGGLTNRNYQVTAGDGRRMVVRLSSPQSAALTIDRDAEHLNAVAAAAAGVAPRVLAYVPDVGALVIDWIDGRTFEAADLDDSRNLRAVAAACQLLHSGPRFSTDFDMFALQRHYLDVVTRNGYRIPESYLDFMPVVRMIRDAMSVRPDPTVPCHNDLLAANIMITETQVWLIDFEYSGNGEPCFELGNLCSESHLSPERLAELVEAYFGIATPGKLARAELFTLMSDYGWTLWAAIQAATSDLDFDFWAWGMEKYDRALEMFHSTSLQRLISDVRQP
jgi:thiamine kinase-like enzyme